MWKEVMEEVVKVLKHLIQTLVIMLNCCRDNSCVSECCVKNEEIIIPNNNKDERSYNKTDKEE